MSHVNGGVAGIAKTRAIDTIESGPILGIQASAHLAGIYGLRDVVAMDIGGTTAKISLLSGGQSRSRRPSDFFGIQVQMSLPDLHSIAIGGGSVLRAIPDGLQSWVRIGPESMGSYPGPVCYGLGGGVPTLTDAFVAAGLINPDYFLGGTKPIDFGLARRTIDDSIAQPLRIPIEDACDRCITGAFEMVAQLIGRAGAIREPSDHTLFAYGGNGGLFACGVADRAGLDRVMVFSLGPVFSAFGSSVSDICHVYERSLPGGGMDERVIARGQQMIADMKADSIQDMRGEGVLPEDVSYTIEVEASLNGGAPRPFLCPEPALDGPAEMARALTAAFALPDKSGVDQISLDLVRLRARKAMPRPRFVEYPFRGEDASAALLGTRAIMWGGRSAHASIYRWESLEAGNRIRGSALVESASTTYLIPEGWEMTIDQLGNGAIIRSS